MNMNFSTLLGSVLCMTLMLGMASSGSVRDDGNAYDQIVTIEGKVQWLNHPDFGTFPAAGQYLVFQREDCSRCLVATRTDADGHYEIMVGKGRYKVIVSKPTPPTYDLLAPGQARYIAANNKIFSNRFDISLKIPQGKSKARFE